MNEQRTINYLLQTLAERISEEADEYNLLVDAHEALLAENQTLRLKIQTLLDQIEQQAQAAEVERLKQKGQLSQLQSELNALKKQGDPAKLVKQNKQIRQAREELRAEKALLQKQYNEKINEVISLRTRLTFLEDFPVYSNKEGETVYLHSQKIKAAFKDGAHEVIVLKYWHTTGIGRLITWNGTKLSLSDGDIEGLNEAISPSQECRDFCLGWFAENVKVAPNGKQTYVGKSNANTPLRRSA